MKNNKIILFGTGGGPRLEKGLSWPTSSVIEIDNHPYVVDCGLGVTRQFVEHDYTLSQLNHIFLTHLHSDHVLELGGLIHTAWTTGVSKNISIYGPKGTQNLKDGMLMSFKVDIETRIADEKQRDLESIINVHEITEGFVMEDERVKVTALQVVHPPLEHCYALKFETKNAKVVFSGDTTFFPPLIEFSKNADVLIHEVMLEKGIDDLVERLKEVKPNLREHLVNSHTYAGDVGKIAEQANVKHLALNHFVPKDKEDYPAKDFIDSVSKNYQGKITVGYDGCKILF